LFIIISQSFKIFKNVIFQRTSLPGAGGGAIMEKRRVVITGIGVVAPNGIGIENFWDSLVHGRSAVRKITHFDASSYPSQIAAEVSDFDPTDYMDPKTAKRLSRFAQFSLAAAEMAVEDAGIDLSREDPYRAGVFIGTAIGGGDVIETQTSIFFEKGLKRLSPYCSISICTHLASGAISYQFGLKGPNTTIASGCNSGLDAIYLAYNAIRLKDADIMIVGAGEAPITPVTFAVFCVGPGFLSRVNGNPKKALKPYDRDRDGTVLGEGGAIVIMEELDHALARKAHIYGEILGYASGNESYNLFEIDPSGDAASIVMRKALENARIRHEDIDYINSHGNGAGDYDINETRAIKKVFKELAYKIPISSIKPVTGQSFSTTGIFQLITCLLVLNKNIIPPTINIQNPDPECDLDYTPIHFRKKTVQNALMNAHGFGGGHTILIVGKYEG
jgi:3-oxoacyl-[acyl-carrier-protein] synthase II